MAGVVQRHIMADLLWQPQNWLWWFVTGFSTWRQGFNPRPVHV